MNAWADTDKLTVADGWTKISSVPTSSEIASNYYVFVDATRDLMLGIGKGVENTKAWYSLALYYRTSVSATSKDITPMVWTLEADNGGFSMRNLDQPVRVFQTEWNASWYFDTNDVTSPNEWSKVNLALADGKWTLENGKYTGNYIGPWSDNNFTNGAECAANKTTALRGYFHIYAISRTQFKQNLLDNASESNPVDVTPWYVTNPTFDGGNRTGWTEEGSGGNNNTSNGGGCEIWHRSGFNIHQDVTLPNGNYKVSLQMAGTTGAGKVYGTSNGTTKENASSAAAGSNFQNTILSMIQDRTFGQTITDEITVSNGSLTIGMKCETTDQWINFDNFKLYCTGLDLSAYVSQLSDLVDECNAFIASDVVPTACESAISSAITTYNQSYETAKEYSTAIVALTAVLNTYRNDTELQSACAAYKTMRTNVQGLENTSTYKYTDPGTAKSTFDAAISSANTAVEAATTASAINAQTANIRAAAMTFISNITAEDGNPFNITFLASQAVSDWKKKDGSAAGEVTWAVTNRGDLSFAESYESTCETTGTVLYQTVGSLPEGYYQVGMYAMAAYTPGRGFASDATEGDADRSFAFAGDQRTGIPIPFKSEFDLSELTTLDVNVHLSSAGDLTFGVQKDKNGSNWHFAQIISICYSNAPDLTGLKATRDALVSEAEGLLASEDANLLTSAQRTDLSTAISAGEAADTFDDLNTATLTTLPNAINTAKSQIATVKANRILMIAALERFENDYNLADGTDYQRFTMSAAAWTTLLAKVNAVTTALDDVSQAANYGTLKDNLVAQLDATDTSLRLFKSYKAMVEGATALSIVGSYGADGNMDTDATQQTAIAALNTAFVTYAAAQSADFSVAAFLGSNLDFSAAEGSALNTDNSNNIHEVSGWEVEYADADTWAVVQTQQSENLGKLYLRKNWGSAATILLVAKQKMLPVGRYRLSLSWNSNMENMTNRSQFKVGESPTAIGQATDGAQTLTYDFEVTENAESFDLILGFQKTGSDNTPAQIVVDDVTLTCLGANSRLLADYDPEALWFDATGSEYASASGVSVTPTASNQLIKAAAATQFTSPTQNIIVDGICANLVLTDKQPLDVQEAFEASTVSHNRTLAQDNDAYTVCLPYSLTSNSDVQFYELASVGDGKLRFNAVATTEAMKPYLAVAKADVSLKPSDNATIAVTTVATTTADDYVMKGTMTGISRADAETLGAYILQSDNVWKIVDSGSSENAKIPPFRAYIVAESAGARSLLDSELIEGTTVVDRPQFVEVREAEFYDLQGRFVGTRPVAKGLYVVSGKKVIKK